MAVSMRIGTRKSTMALAQTEDISRRLSLAAPELNVDIVKFETTGDTDQTSKLLVHGGKGGAFVAEIRAAVVSGKLHAAMHSPKGYARQRGYAGPGDRRDAGARSAHRRTGAAAGRFDRRYQALARQGLQDRNQRHQARGLCAAAVSGDRGDPLRGAADTRCASSITGRCSACPMVARPGRPTR